MLSSEISSVLITISNQRLRANGGGDAIRVLDLLLTRIRRVQEG